MIYSFLNGISKVFDEIISVFFLYLFITFKLSNMLVKRIAYFDQANTLIFNLLSEQPPTITKLSYKSIFYKHYFTKPLFYIYILSDFLSK